MALDIDERSLEHCSTRLQSIAIPWNNGPSSLALFARTWFALAAPFFRSVGMHHPFGSVGEPWELAEINGDSSKRIGACAWTTLIQKRARCEALPRHRRQHRRYCAMTASWEDA
jgi:hypothetical protein